MFSVMLKLFEDDQVADQSPAALKQKVDNEKGMVPHGPLATEFKTMEFGCTSISDETALSDISLSSCESKPHFVFKDYGGVASMVDQIESARSEDDMNNESKMGIDRYESVEASRRRYRKVTLIFDDIIPPHADTVDYLQATMAQDQDDDDDLEGSASTSFSSVGSSSSEEEALIGTSACYYLCYSNA